MADSKSQTTVSALRMTAYPPGNGPYDRWELTVEATGEILAAGAMPIDPHVVQTATDAYRARAAGAAPTPKAQDDQEPRTAAPAAPTPATATD